MLAVPVTPLVGYPGQSHLILLLHPWVCRGIYSVFAWALAYSQESEASDLAQADRVTAKSRRVGWTSFQKQFKEEAESRRG